LLNIFSPGTVAILKPTYPIIVILIFILTLELSRGRGERERGIGRKQADIEIYSRGGMQTGRHMKETHRNADIETSRRTEGQAEGQIDVQISRLTNRS
jgi:hypothetical protein